MPSHYVGQRLSYSSKLCSVRYVGELPNTNGTWIGVEWDDPFHGKHNGTHNGVRYFTCLKPFTTAASFIRPSRPFDKSASFITAVREKYAPDSSYNFSGSTREGSGKLFADSVITAAAASDIREHHQRLSQRPVRFGTKLAEEVGFDKIAAEQSNLAGLKVIALDGWRVDGLLARDDLPEEEARMPISPAWWSLRESALAEVRENLPKVTELDLSSNLIERWSDIVAISSSLPHLQILRLSGNRFRELHVLQSSESCELAFENVAELVLDSTLLHWTQILEIVSFFPNLQTVSVAFNGLSSISTPLTGANLKAISLNSNAISSLMSLSPLSRLPNLETLTLQSNSIESLSPCPIFPQLKHLDLSDNSIPDLSSLTSLSPPDSTSAAKPLPNLVSIRLSRNPFFRALPTDLAHILTLARLPHVAVLNYSRISTEERTNADLYYLALIARQVEATAEGSEAEAAVLAEHPLWDDLCRKYERPQIRLPDSGASAPKHGGFAPGTLGARIVALRVKAATDAIRVYRATNGRMPDAAPTELYDGCVEDSWTVRVVRVSRSTSIYALKSSIGEAFGVLPAQFRLVWETGEWDPVRRGPAGGRAPVTRSMFDRDTEGTDEADDDIWSVPSEVGDDLGQQHVGDNTTKGTWVHREVEIEAGTSSVGFWIEGNMATLRLEMLIS